VISFLPLLFLRPLVDGFLIDEVDGFDPQQSHLRVHRAEVDVDDKRQGGAAPVSCRAVDDEQIDGVLMVGLPLLRENFVSGTGGGLDDDGCGEDEHVSPGSSVLRPR